ncbi:TRAP transporter small permease subunit [Oleiphilus sp. HI0125]|uniref:TRAP transporter small permease subunit n=1 Tax=Oleiphilus sp. HI0125 TaxID=1822266 RepID=UPI000B005215
MVRAFFYMIERLDWFCRKATSLCGFVACILMLLMLLNVFYDVVMRYVFNDVSIGMQELEWHLFAAVFLLGTPYAMQRDGHVRVDIFYEGWSDQRKAIVNLVGALIFIFPFVALVTYYGASFAHDAYSIGEGSGDPGGLPYRWIIKSLIPISFIFIGIAALGMMTKAILVLKGRAHYQQDNKGMLS